MAGLEDLYKEIVIDHYRSPRNRGDLESPPALHAEGLNPLCGDEVHVYIDVVDDTVIDVKISGQGCSISQASASMMTVAIKGKPLSEVRDLVLAVKSMMSIHERSLDEDDSGVLTEPPDVELGDLEALKGVVKYPVRIKCATLGWNTLVEALAT